MTFSTITLGCKVNSYESGAISEIFLLNGYTINKDNPDVLIINTCSVTSVADQKSRQIIRRYRNKFPKSIIVVMGCYSQNNSKYIKDNCGADIIIGTKYRNEIFDLVKQFQIDHQPIVKIDNNTRKYTYESFGVNVALEKTRAYIKIEDGCNNFCTYCTIPYTRGVARSRDKNEIINEIKYLISEGYKEFVLTGIHTAHYGVDNKDGYSFSDLVEEIVNIDGLYRLRISSIEESEIDDKLIYLLSKYDNIANHLHMPLQSGSSTVLKRMGRKYNVDDFIKKVERIRKIRPDISLTTDVIVGFPGESEEEFLETYDFVKKVNFAELHVFPFSARKGTKAYDYPNQIDPTTKSKRVSKLIELSNELSKQYRSKFIGKDFEVILEERNKLDHKLYGFTSNYLKLGVDLPDEYIGKIYKLKVD